MNQQIRITPNRAGEMGVSIKSQTEVPAVDRGVNGLLHGAQQHRVNLLGIRAVFGGVGNRLKFARSRVVADAQT